MSKHSEVPKASRLYLKVQGPPPSPGWQEFPHKGGGQEIHRLPKGQAPGSLPSQGHSRWNQPAPDGAGRCRPSHTDRMVFQGETTTQVKAGKVDWAHWACRPTGIASAQ